jgi:type II secretory pathway pseudopilin PulG
MFRARVLVPLLAVLAIVGGVGLALFQPWKLWVDERVDAAAPAGATPIEVTPSPVAAPATTSLTSSPISAPAEVAPPAPSAADPRGSDTTVPTTAVVTEPPSAGLVSLDHGTSGTVQLLADASGRRFVRILDLATDNGPDLKVYLSANPVDGPEGAFDDEFVDLGRLQGNLGSQNYEIPADVDLARFRSVVIWCDRFNSAFGAAALTA